MFERLLETSRLNEHIDAFYRASRESVARAQIVSEKKRAEREKKFQTGVAVAGVTLAAIVLGEITISIASGTANTTDGGRVEASVAILVMTGALFISPWLIISTMEEWSLRWRSWGVLAGGAFLMPELLAFGRWWLKSKSWSPLDFDPNSLPAFFVFGDFWWLWPGLPLLGLTMGAAVGCIIKGRTVFKSFKQVRADINKASRLISPNPPIEA